MRWFQPTFKTWLADLPSTNFRIFVDTTTAVLLSTLLVGRVLIGGMTYTWGAGHSVVITEMTEGTILAASALIVAMAGWSAAQFYVKRKTDSDYVVAQNGEKPAAGPQ